MIFHFKFDDFENIENHLTYHTPPSSTERIYDVSWYSLTYGLLWLTFGNHTIFEYTAQSIAYFQSLGETTVPNYYDYHISRFFDDFCYLFNAISEPLPESLYQLSEDPTQFFSKLREWNTDLESKQISYHEYDQLTDWIWARSIDSAYLIGGPRLFFFRHADQLRVVWNTEFSLENGIKLWTAPNACFEMQYNDFIAQVELFGSSLFKEMEKRIALATAKDWGTIIFDRERITQSHQSRKIQFQEDLLQLKRK